MGLSDRGVWGVPTGTPTPRASRTAVSRRCCCWRSMSAISRGRELKLALSCSSLDSRPLSCFSRSSLRSFSSVMRSYITFCIWGGDSGGLVPWLEGLVPLLLAELTPLPFSDLRAAPSQPTPGSPRVLRLQFCSSLAIKVRKLCWPCAAEQWYPLQKGLQGTPGS